MLRKEFESALKPLCQQLGVKMNRFQQDHYYEEFGKKDLRDFRYACGELGFGKQGWLPDVAKFRDFMSASWEYRTEQEKIKKESEVGSVNQINFTPQERLEANRGAYEALRQSKACRATGTNCCDPKKVRAAIKDSSKDEEIRKKYGDEGISPAQVFGTSFLPMKEKANG